MTDDQIVTRLNRLETNTLKALEGILGKHLPMLATLTSSHTSRLDAMQKEVDKLREQVAALEKRPARIYGAPNG